MTEDGATRPVGAAAPTVDTGDPRRWSINVALGGPAGGARMRQVGGPPAGLDLRAEGMR